MPSLTYEAGAFFAFRGLVLTVVGCCLLLDGCTGVEGAFSPPTLVKSYENDTVLLPCHVEDLGES